MGSRKLVRRSPNSLLIRRPIRRHSLGDHLVHSFVAVLVAWIISMWSRVKLFFCIDLNIRKISPIFDP